MHPRTTATLWGLRGFAILAVGGVIAAGVMLSPPQPDSILHPSGVAPDDQLVTLLAAEGAEFDFDRSALRGASEMEIDLSTLRAFGTYRDIELWSAVNVFESPCLIAVHRATVDVVARQCVPAGGDLFIDTQGSRSPGGESLRFFLHGDAVDVYLLLPEEAG